MVISECRSTLCRWVSKNTSNCGIKIEIIFIIFFSCASSSFWSLLWSTFTACVQHGNINAYILMYSWKLIRFSKLPFSFILLSLLWIRMSNNLLASYVFFLLIVNDTLTLTLTQFFCTVHCVQCMFYIKIIYIRVTVPILRVFFNVVCDAVCIWTTGKRPLVPVLRTYWYYQWLIVANSAFFHVVGNSACYDSLRMGGCIRSSPFASNQHMGTVRVRAPDILLHTRQVYTIELSQNIGLCAMQHSL
jgi:hypothetical protein